MKKARCQWAGMSDPLYLAYHDDEWGVPSHDDRHLFEMLILEGAQAGLSWSTILKKRANYRRAYDRFDPRKVARYGAAERRRLLADAGIVRNRLKVEASIQNARAFLAVQEEFGSFAAFAWSFVGGAPVVNARRTLRDIPPRTEQSDAFSKALLRRGFKFVGSTIMYAFMQATGMVNDHQTDCFRYGPTRRMAAAGRRATAALPKPRASAGPAAATVRTKSPAARSRAGAARRKARA
jgi:DNA-3-methyladenine glycosylase I